MTEPARRRWGSALALLVAGSLALGGGVTVWVLSALRSPLQIDAPRTVMVAPGTGLVTLIRQLGAQGVLEQPLALRLGARLGQAPRRIVAGEYRLAPGQTPRQLFADLAAGRVVQHAFVIVPGWRFAELLAALWASEVLTPTLRGQDAAAVMTALRRGGEPAEGRFLPETYHVTRGTTDLALLRRALLAMDDALAAEWAARGEVPLASAQQALVLASVVERETAQREELPMVAAVFLRRLTLGMPLQADPTVIYGLGSAYTGNLTREHLRTDTPWNTYTRTGLPVTPIALPGRAALHATLHPADGPWMYFVGRGDGTHEFTSTLAAHNRAVERYQRARAPGDG